MTHATTTIHEPDRDIGVIHQTEVLVVGSGPGGLAAALAAARAGAQVTLVERFGCFGGNLTVVGVEGFAWYRHEQTVEANGIGREFEERAKASYYATALHELTHFTGHHHRPPAGQAAAACGADRHRLEPAA